MMRLLFLLVPLFLQTCTTKRYKMVNMLGGESYVDVTELVKKEKYDPIYCGFQKNVVCKLIKPNQSPINSKYEDELMFGFKKWIVDSKLNFDTSLINNILLSEHSSYQYSYLITYDLVDVYLVEISINNDTLKSFFRIDKNHILMPFKEDGWVN
jgi:hypothetical protein